MTLPLDCGGSHFTLCDPGPFEPTSLGQPEGHMWWFTYELGRDTAQMFSSSSATVGITGTP